MEPAKVVFAKTTENLIREFVNHCYLFAVKFNEEGPGADKYDLEQGFNLMEVSIFFLPSTILLYMKLQKQKVDI